MSQNNETAAMLVSQTNPLGIELFSYANTFFCFSKFALMLATWVKTLYKQQKITIQIKRFNRIKNPNWQEANSWIFTSMAEDLNSEWPRTNKAGDWSRTRNWVHWIGSPLHWPLGHVISCLWVVVNQQKVWWKFSLVYLALSWLYVKIYYVIYPLQIQQVNLKQQQS